ncbi:hypothetical protein GobsT_10030 [Gemmata obscuriglobus]|uniref:DUF3307 domain-containing protein n=1 Tax=Gemmata obscuriglobus TaxID=114 RepID=A0A2Z3H7W1_9BACT|nr:DUF3307 domain-containing protein [Gemmata obscuriglobus]AWM40492.1 DUF3307 domain-containing protein [Gemmata obscuriglobus]QEG26264.1 hypothetical protein GobsT_10030 [Gemmata obscuriglobus]VTS01081.1 Uncharacterized protein OS=Synechococcus sp. (strain ATCC 27144 / PCC 6301 / SAUG 1402/1) GN=syc1903_d PE=4 SV=1: DUF3307 [Gemmata obscuriglobus UQM 2246]
MLFALLFFLIASHALMDYSLQNDTMASCKCRQSTHQVAVYVPWYYWLTSHAMLHGVGVGVVFRWMGFDWNVVAAVAVAETAIHWVTDYGKCAKWYSLHADQAIHITCKLVWWALVAAEVVKPVGA